MGFLLSCFALFVQGQTYQQTFYRTSDCSDVPVYTEGLPGLKCIATDCTKDVNSPFYRIITCPQDFVSLGITRNVYESFTCSGAPRTMLSWSFEHCIPGVSGTSFNFICLNASAFLRQDFQSNEYCGGCPTTESVFTSVECNDDVANDVFKYESSVCGQGVTIAPSPPKTFFSNVGFTMQTSVALFCFIMFLVLFVS